MKEATQWIALPLLTFMLTLCEASEQEPISVQRYGLAVECQSDSGMLSVKSDHAGTLIDQMRLVPIDSTSSTKKQPMQVKYQPDKIILDFGRAGTVLLELLESESLRVTVKRGATRPFLLCCRPALSPHSLPALLKHESTRDRGVLRTRIGPAPFSDIRSLYDPGRDLALSIEGGSGGRWVYEGRWEYCVELRADGRTVTIRFWPDYYKNVLGIEFFAPIEKRSYWQTAPMLAMTWYGIEGWKGSPAQTKEWLYPQIDWVAKHLLPYAGHFVFQLDDNYPYKDDRYMRDISDYIRSKGLIPGIWFTPFGIAPSSVAAKHPDWFLRGPEGEFLTAFAGVNYHDVTSSSSYVLNVNNAEAVRNWYAMFWRKVSDTWNYDFFKIDGQPDVISQYKRSLDGSGLSGYRRGLRIARRIVGPDKFINACYGIALEAIGLVNGARTGPDTGLQPHANDVVIRWNFLNNVAWWSDPDAAANQYAATVERVRFNAQARLLTGQPFLTDDIWTKMPERNTWVWQRCFPTSDIYPVNLYRIENWSRYDLFDLRIAHLGRVWDVVGLFNYQKGQVTKQLQLDRLALPAERVHVFEFWSATYLGQFKADDTIVISMKPYEGQLFAIVPAVEERPSLVSTNRHGLQGVADLTKLNWRRTGQKWTVTGRSKRLVSEDPYALTFVCDRYAVANVEVEPKVKVHVKERGGVTAVSFSPQSSGLLDWSITFSLRTGAALGVQPAVLELLPGQSGKLLLQSLGTEKLAVRPVASDSRIHLLADAAVLHLGPWPSRKELELTVDLAGLEHGSRFRGTLQFIDTKDNQRLATAALCCSVPLPPNLAQVAKATASSYWASQAAYGPQRINDGLSDTRWNSAQGDLKGAWVQLQWPEPVEFNRIVVDECVDFGPRVRKWRLEAGNGQLQVLARGEKLGQNKIVHLEKPVKAKKLRFVIESATVSPTIWELEVYRWVKRH